MKPAIPCISLSHALSDTTLDAADPLRHRRARVQGLPGDTQFVQEGPEDDWKRLRRGKSALKFKWIEIFTGGSMIDFIRLANAEVSDNWIECLLRGAFSSHGIISNASCQHVQVALLFRQHHDLLEEFTYFLPDAQAPAQVLLPAGPSMHVFSPLLVCYQHATAHRSSSQIMQAATGR